jgi:hypothetical protein
MFRPYYNGHLQASILGGAINTIAIRNIRDLVLRVKTAVYIGIYIILSTPYIYIHQYIQQFLHVIRDLLYYVLQLYV